MDDYQRAKPNEAGSDGGQMRPTVEGLMRRGVLEKVVSKGELWVQYEIWFEKGRAAFGKPVGWTSQKIARAEGGWTVCLRFNHKDNKALWMLRSFDRKHEPRFTKPLTEGAWQRITVRVYDIGTSEVKADSWHQDAAQKKADVMWKGVVSKEIKKGGVINKLILMNGSSGHGGAPFPDHDFSVLYRNWIVSTEPIDLGEGSIGN